MDNDRFEEWRRYLPHYLNDDDKRALYSELKQFPDGMRYFGEPPDDEPLQGDGWKPFLLRDYETGAEREVSGIVISNSCDVVPGNTVDGRQNVLFAPLQSLERVIERLRLAGESEAQIQSQLNAIRRQEKTDVLYIPAVPGGIPETFVRLDDIRPQPLQRFLSGKQTRLFSLNQAAFYILLIKLAIHFTRIQERVHRNSSL